MYAEIGEPPPKFLWVKSPATACLAIWAIKRVAKDEKLGDSLWVSLRASLGVSLRDSLWASLGDSLGASLGVSLRDSLGDSLWASLGVSLRASLGASLWASLRDSLGDSLRDSLGDSLWASLWASLGASLGDSLWASLGDSLRDSLSKEWWGQNEVYWIAYYVFCRDVVGVQYDEKRSLQLDLWSEIAQSCGWWWPYRGLCIVSERPEVVRWETDRERPRLHCGDGPALRFRDGWEVYSWRGLRVPVKLILERDAIKPADIHAEQNQELRRAMFEIVGWDRYLHEAGARSIHADDSGELLEVDGLGDGDRVARFVHVRCPSTGHEYTLRVPPDTMTAKAGVAWTFNVEPNSYRPDKET
jgi:hypothetical protein